MPQGAAASNLFFITAGFGPSPSPPQKFTKSTFCLCYFVRKSRFTKFPGFIRRTENKAKLGGGGSELRRADTQNPDTLAFSARTLTRKRFPHSIAYECLKAFFRHARVFQTHRHAVYQCVKKPPTYFRHASLFKTLAFRHARVRFKTRVFAHLRFRNWWWFQSELIGFGSRSMDLRTAASSQNRNIRNF